MILYRPVAWKDDEECDFSPIYSYREAQELGEEYYPSGYDVEECDTEEED